MPSAKRPGRRPDEQRRDPATTVPAGPVDPTPDLFELHPFRNIVVRLDVTGLVLKQVLEHALAETMPTSPGATVR